ncbi:MAG TPA: DICT sensory domain-containing protein [Acidimicrobiales bacterium]|nr:DICT sensory domain-containing protein [Acidimicrobiales bacterium]
MSRRTGVPESTIRAWEKKYGIPRPVRLTGGHRRYLAADCAVVTELAAARARGTSLARAIEGVKRGGAAAGTSLFESVRLQAPSLPTLRLSSRAVLAISRAIEDEQLEAARPSILVGAFQRALFYERQKRRWHRLAATSLLTLVLADFASPRTEAGEPFLIPIASNCRLSREWAVVCHGPTLSASVVAQEVTDPGTPERFRRFETIWSVDHDLTAEVTAVAHRLAEPHLSSCGTSMPMLGLPVRRVSDVRSARVMGRIVTALDRR